VAASGGNRAIGNPAILAFQAIMNVGALAVKDKWFFQCYFNAISMLYFYYTAKICIFIISIRFLPD